MLPLRAPDGADVSPRGWVATTMRRDLVDGVVGHLDRLAPDLLVDDDIYGRDRLGTFGGSKDLGTVDDDGDWAVQRLWWNSETQSNWRAGWVRHAFAVGDEEHRAAARAWVRTVLSGQDDDGYLGIYAPDLRFRGAGENGELWAQATLLRALLGYVGHTGDAGVLAAVRRAADRTLAELVPGRLHPFGTVPSYAGTAHGLMFADVLWELWLRTGDERYLDHVTALFDAYARAPVSEPDIRPADLGSEQPFRGHGVHTYEHRRVLLYARHAERLARSRGGTPSGDRPGSADRPSFEVLDERYRAKLAAALTPTGAPNGDESCRPVGRADTGYEFCSLVELLSSYAVAARTTTDDDERARLGDAMESLLLNAALGARDPVTAGLAYLSTDDRHALTGAGTSGRDDDGPATQTRYRFSPVHREAAVCCTPNAGRLLPAFLDALWMSGAGALWAVAFAPSEVRTRVAGVDVGVEQVTDYPASGRVRFLVRAGVGVDLDLRVRIPGWADRWSVRTGHRRTTQGAWVVVHGPWAGEEVVDLDLGMPVRLVDVPPEKADAPATTVAAGPLLFALPLDGRRETTRVFGVGAGRFREVLVHPVGEPVQDVVLDRDSLVEAAPREVPDGPSWWGRRVRARVRVGGAAAWQQVELVPMAAADLRRVTFTTSADG